MATQLCQPVGILTHECNNTYRARRSLFSSEDHLILSLEKQWPGVWPFEKHLPGEHSSYQKLPEGGWITGIQAVENRGIDLRLFYREPDETNIWGTIDGACRLSDSASIGTGFGLSAHGGAVSLFFFGLFSSSLSSVPEETC